MATQEIAIKPVGTPLNAVGMAREGSGSRVAPQNLGEVVKFAEVMSRADIALPKHLRGNAGACMAVALQALDWQMNPFAVASKSYQVNGIIAYEAQLIMAVINTRSGIEGRLKFRFEGEGSERVCIAFGKIDGDDLEVQSPKFKDISPKNSPLWKTDPDQQHCYYTARAWGRRHTPEVILGVYDRDEAQSIKDVTPPAGSGFAARLAGGNNGFDADGVENALAEVTEDAQDAQREPDDATPQGNETHTPEAPKKPEKAASTTPDPEIIRDGASAARDGQERIPPEGLDEFQIKVWFDAYDKAFDELEIEAGVSA